MKVGSGQLALIGRVARAKELRRLNLAFVAFAISEHASWLAVLFYALARGGAEEVGIVAVVQLAPAVLLTPFSSMAGDRFSPRTALAAGYGAQCIAMTATAAAMWADAPVIAYVCAAGAAAAVSFTRPVMGALLPTVVRTPRDLVAVNVVSGLIEQVGVFVGPLIAGVTIAVSSPAGAFAMTAVLTGAACLATFGVPADADQRIRSVDARGALGAAFAGFSALRHTPHLRVLLIFIACAGVARGVGDWAFVVLAEDRLGSGGGVAGLLAGAAGVGGFVGAIATARLGQAGYVVGQFSVASACIVVAIAVTSVVDHLLPTMLAMGALGAGGTVLVIASVVSVQRQTPSDVLARVSGIVEGSLMASIAAGSFVLSLLVRRASLGAAFVIVAAVIALVLLVAVASLRRNSDELAPVDEAIVARLLDDPVFSPLSAPTIERLARHAERLSVGTGESIIRQGDPGDRYYVVVEGTVAIDQDGQRIRELSAGDSFGEIALVRDVPRTATATATTGVELIAVERDDFLAAVTGHSRALATTHRVVDGFLDPHDR